MGHGYFLSMVICVEVSYSDTPRLGMLILSQIGDMIFIAMADSKTKSQEQKESQGAFSRRATRRQSQTKGAFSPSTKSRELSQAKKTPVHALIFTGGEFPPPERTVRFWESPLVFGAARRPDFVVAADSGIEALRVYCDYFDYTDLDFRHADSVRPKIDFSPDLILGDFDSISDYNILSQYPDEIIAKSSAYKDLTDTELAINAVRSRFKDAFVTLIGGEGGRADHFLGIFDLFGGKASPDAWLCGEQILLNARRRKFFIENLDAQSPISVARASREFRGGKIMTRGLEWESGVFRKRGMPSISNTISSEYFKEKRPVEFHFRRGAFVLILPISAKISIERM